MSTTNVSKRERIIEQIQAEKAAVAGAAGQTAVEHVVAGRPERGRGILMYLTPQGEIESSFEAVVGAAVKGMEQGGVDERAAAVQFLVGLAVDLSTYPVHVHIERCMDREAVASLVGLVEGAIREVSDAFPQSVSDELARLRKLVLGRLEAEGVEDRSSAEREADELIQSSLLSYVHNLSDRIRRSGLYAASLCRLRGETATQLGNDYAAYLDYVLWLGATFATTNPVLVKMAWDIDPARWNRNADEIIQRLSIGREPGEAAVEDVASAVTMAVVVENCGKLRDIFLYTDGAEGYVSLQVNPRNHGDPERMVSEVTALHAQLAEAFGGVPNVVFKLPSTRAGLIAAEALTGEGIGVTITLTFSLFQAVEFAQVLDRGEAPVSYIAFMNGRLAYPVRDELRELLGQEGVDAARLSGVEVVRKAYRTIYRPASEGGLGVDEGKVKMMVASLRVYDGWIPDISELWGVPLLTVFPNVRRSYDSQPRTVDQGRINADIDDRTLEQLLESELFRQAWWRPGEPDSMKPRRPLTLEAPDEAAVVAWQPVAETLDQFNGLYDEMCALIRERISSTASGGV